MALKKIFDAFSGKKEKSEQIEENQNARALLQSDQFPIVQMPNSKLSQYKRIPLTEIAALGASFAQLPTSARTIVQTVTSSVPTNQRIFVGLNPKNVPGWLTENQFGTVGNIMQLNKQGKQIIAGRMRFKEITGGMPLTSTTATTIPFNPDTMVLAAALMNIEQKLSDLQKAVEEVLQFLTLDKQTKQRGNLNTLAEIMDEFKQRHNDENLCRLRNIEVQTIKREAQQNILFYQEQIARQLKEQSVLHFSQKAQALLNQIMNEFYEYQLACYLYAYSSTLDIMLQKNFETSVIEATATRIKEHESRYTELYTTCHAQLEDYHKTSLEAQIVGGVGVVVKSLGNMIASIPFLRDGTVDETLISAGESLDNSNKKALEEQMKKFETVQDSRMQPFVENMDVIKTLYHGENNMLTDGESLYILETT